MTFTEKLKNFFGIRKTVSAELFEELADVLVEGDFGSAEAFKITEDLETVCKKERIGDGETVRQRLAAMLEDILIAPQAPNFQSGTVILLLGINGVGKTTTAAKLAHMCLDKGKTPVLAAADTFRAAAIDQLKIHGERLGVRVVAHQRGGNPAAVIYDAIEAAAGTGIVIADTAGRMHTKSALVEELKKIDRVVESKAPNAQYLKWLALDATTGRNAVSQAEVFKEAVAVGGVVLTKADSSAKGGAIFSLSSSLKLPVVFVCSGEKYGDIAPFNPKAYARTFVGL
ncbi:MAG: signal recognition particle-docking protein FtsY [Treponema sp.]|jgi:fused signal recognition particle receptor|nr:signal recognition particle-docking protein FtsY [Treponema sp.]